MYGGHCNFGGACQGKIIDSGADGGESYGFEAVLFGELEAVSVAICQKLVLAIISTLPNRPYCVNHVFGGQAVPFGDFSLTRFATV